MTNETLSEDLKIYAHIAERFAVSRAALETLLDKKEKGEWRVEGALSAQTKMDQKFHVILYDAYSSKTDTDLWTEEFLQVFLAKAAAEKCIFTTYACTGPLKRSLKQAGFEVTLREGFHGKRQSTLATRGF